MKTSEFINNFTCISPTLCFFLCPISVRIRSRFWDLSVGWKWNTLKDIDIVMWCGVVDKYIYEIKYYLCINFCIIYLCIRINNRIMGQPRVVCRFQKEFRDQALSTLWWLTYFTCQWLSWTIQFVVLFKILLSLELLHHSKVYIHVLYFSLQPAVLANIPIY